MIRAVGYWLVVFVVSLALVVGLIMLIESRDPSSVSGSGAAMPVRVLR